MTHRTQTFLLTPKAEPPTRSLRTEAEHVASAFAVPILPTMPTEKAWPTGESEGIDLEPPMGSARSSVWTALPDGREELRSSPSALLEEEEEQEEDRNEGDKDQLDDGAARGWPDLPTYCGPTTTAAIAMEENLFSAATFAPPSATEPMPMRPNWASQGGEDVQAFSAALFAEEATQEAEPRQQQQQPPLQLPVSWAPEVARSACTGDEVQSSEDELQERAPPEVEVRSRTPSSETAPWLNPILREIEGPSRTATEVPARSGSLLDSFVPWGGRRLGAAPEQAQAAMTTAMPKDTASVAASESDPSDETLPPVEKETQGRRSPWDAAASQANTGLWPPMQDEPGRAAVQGALAPSATFTWPDEQPMGTGCSQASRKASSVTPWDHDQGSRRPSRSPWDEEVTVAATSSIQEPSPYLHRTPANHDPLSPPPPSSACSAASMPATLYLGNPGSKGDSPGARSNFSAGNPFAHPRSPRSSGESPALDFSPLNPFRAS